MREQPTTEPGETGRRRPDRRAVLALGGIIAVVAAVGIAISLAQHPRGVLVGPATVITPAPGPITPSPVPLEPQAGIGVSIADDLATHEIVLFGGVGDYANTWLWDGSKWTLAHPGASPEGRFGAAEAYDPQTRTVMLFGGRLEPGTPVHDTWAWNGTSWLDLDSGAGGPPPGEGSDMAWDPTHKQMVLLTRSGVISAPAETWVWDGTHWNQPRGAALPPGASYSPMWVDPASRTLLAVGCCVGPPPSTGGADTTWRWNGVTWTLLPTPAHAPVGGTTLALDPVLNRLVLCACDPSTLRPALSVWDGTTWAPLTTRSMPVTGGIETTDYDRHELLLFSSPHGANASGQAPVWVWQLIGSTWSRLGPTA